MRFEIEAENEAGFTIRELIDGRRWFFMIIEQEGVRSLSD